MEISLRNSLLYLLCGFGHCLPPKGPFRKILRLFEVKINFLAPRLKTKKKLPSTDRLPLPRLLALRLLEFIMLDTLLFSYILKGQQIQLNHADPEEPLI